MTSKPGPGHQCEPWQIRRADDGTRYCAACGERPSREGSPEQWDRLLADVVAAAETCPRCGVVIDAAEAWYHQYGAMEGGVFVAFCQRRTQDARPLPEVRRP